MHVYITAIRLSNSGRTHEHITHVWWHQTDTSWRDYHQMSTVETMVEWLGQPANSASVVSPINAAKVAVGVNGVARRFLQTHADGNWSNNLLSLPQK